MRILHLDSSRLMQGGQYQLLLLLNALADLGHESILLAHPHGALYQVAADNQPRWTVYPLSSFRVWQWSTRVDAIHAHDAHSHTLAALGCRKPFCVSRRVAFPAGTSGLSRWKYRRAACFLAVSYAVAQQLQAAGVAHNRIQVVPDGVPERPLLWRWSTTAPLVTIRSDDPNKGTDLVAAAVRSLPRELQARHPLLLSSNLERDLPDGLAFLYLSASEGLGSAALMAMSWGVPVIASPAGGLAEIFEDGVSGLYVERSPAALSSALMQLAGDSELATRLSRGGFHRVRQAFSVGQMAQRTVAAYGALTDVAVP